MFYVGFDFALAPNIEDLEDPRFKQCFFPQVADSL